MDRFNKALEYSFLLLRCRARTRKEICTRLKQKGYDIHCVEKVVKFLEDNNYLNDKVFVRLFIDYSLENNWGPLKVKFKLKNLGIPDSLCKEISNNDIVFNEKIRELAKARWNHHRKQGKKIIPMVLQKKIIQYIVSRGFLYEDVDRQLQEFFEKDGGQI